MWDSKRRERKEKTWDPKEVKISPCCQDFCFQAGPLALLASKPNSTGCATAWLYFAACAAFLHHQARVASASTNHNLLLGLRDSDRAHPPPFHAEARGKVKLRLASALNQALQQMARVTPDLSTQLQMPVFMASSQKDNTQCYFFLACRSPETSSMNML